PTIRELLASEASLGRDDERFQNSLGDRITEKEMSCLPANRKLDAERSNELGRVVSRGDDDLTGGDPAPVAQRELPGRALLGNRRDLAHDERRAVRPRRLRERLDHGLRVVEKAVLRTPRRTGEATRVKAG